MSSPFSYPPPTNSKISLSLVDQRGEDETHWSEPDSHHQHHASSSSSFSLLAEASSSDHHHHSSAAASVAVGRSWEEHSPDLPPEIQAAYRDARARGLPPGWTCTIDVRTYPTM